MLVFILSLHLQSVGTACQLLLQNHYTLALVIRQHCYLIIRQLQHLHDKRRLATTQGNCWTCDRKCSSLSYTTAVMVYNVTHSREKFSDYELFKYLHLQVTCKRFYTVILLWPRTLKNNLKTRMWANAQRDGRPAEYRWCLLLNAAKFGWLPLLECCAVMLPRLKTRWNLQGCPKLPNRSQPSVGRSSPYYKDMWRRYCCLSFFSNCRYEP